MHWNEKESTDSKYNFNAYVTMEVNLEGSELPTPVVRLILRGSILEYGNGKASTVQIYNPSTCVALKVDRKGCELHIDYHCFCPTRLVRFPE